MPEQVERIVRVRISGRVQGVGFRAWTVEEASFRSLRGWVRNLRKGAVEAVFAGDADRVEEMIAACRQGPAHARVLAVEVSDADEAMARLAGDRRFRQLPTA
jgi:acylphosphatase